MICLSRTSTVLRAAALVGLIGNAAAADFTRWEYRADTTSKGTALCSLATAGADNQVTRNIVIKLLAGKQTMNVTLYKASWQIPQATNVPVQIDFLDGQPLALTGFGDGKIVDIELPKDATATFLGLLRSKKAFRLTFDRGNEGAWTAPLTSVQPKLRQFVACAQQLTSKPF
ncbi:MULTISPECIES: hypothetical protein [unclassified Variovorax]|uniref:hypothetical protein n=1 Tax=unclassified Variovorax TaxID=663243 RepID=UPI003F4511A0